MADPHEILSVVLSEYADADKWKNARFEHIKRISNTHVGSVGQDFLEKLCVEHGLEFEFPTNAAGERSKNSPWDIRIEGVEFELKTATEDVGGNFQFNHIRYHRKYEAVLCLGISPGEIYFGAWSKADVVTGQAGTLVSMEKGANASHKLTKKPEQLHPIGQFPKVMGKFLSGFSTRKDI